MQNPKDAAAMQKLLEYMKQKQATESLTPALTESSNSFYPAPFLGKSVVGSQKPSMWSNIADFFRGGPADPKDAPMPRMPEPQAPVYHSPAGPQPINVGAGALPANASPATLGATPQTTEASEGTSNQNPDSPYPDFSSILGGVAGILDKKLNPSTERFIMSPGVKNIAQKLEAQADDQPDREGIRVKKLSHIAGAEAGATATALRNVKHTSGGSFGNLGGDAMRGLAQLSPMATGFAQMKTGVEGEYSNDLTTNHQMRTGDLNAAGNMYDKTMVKEQDNSLIDPFYKGASGLAALASLNQPKGTETDTVFTDKVKKVMKELKMIPQ